MNYNSGLTAQEQEITFSVNVETKVLTVNIHVSLKDNYLYTVHVFNDGDSSDEDNYKTWWQFTTGTSNAL